MQNQFIDRFNLFLNKFLIVDFIVHSLKYLLEDNVAQLATNFVQTFFTPPKNA